MTGPHVLAIEDNAANRELMGYLLAAYGCQVTMAEDGEEGVARAVAQAPDLILCDVQMPKLDGYGVLRRLHTDPALRAIPVIAVTAYAMVGDRDRILSAGFNGYIPKPIDPQSFVDEVFAFLGRAPSPRRVDETADAPAAAPCPPVQATRATLLVVDDSPANLEVLTETFRPLGFKVVTATSLDGALRLCRADRPDLILSDLHMPGGGEELARKLGADPNLQSIPFVLMTASLGDKPRPSTGRAGAVTRLIRRPIEPALLIAQVEALLRPPLE